MQALCKPLAKRVRVSPTAKLIPALPWTKIRITYFIEFALLILLNMTPGTSHSDRYPTCLQNSLSVANGFRLSKTKCICSRWQSLRDHFNVNLMSNTDTNSCIKILYLLMKNWQNHFISQVTGTWYKTWCQWMSICSDFVQKLLMIWLDYGD